MRSGRRAGIGAVIVGLVLSTVQAAGAVPPSTAVPGQDTITLITGDQVVMVGENNVTVRPGKGREKVIFSTHTVDGHIFVMPSDALRLVGSGWLDRRLFDVTTLREFGYDDAHRDSIPLIVTHPEGQAAPRVSRVSRDLPSVSGVAMAADKTGAAWAALTSGGAMRTTAAGVSKVWLDGKREASLDRSAAQIGAPSAWAAGYTGAGVKVAVLDTGVDQTHPDLADREIAEQNFSESPDSTDNRGHGTHVASILAGTGAKSGGRYRGIASGVSILDGKVLADDGWGTDSGIIAGMQWAAEQGADIANMSLGGADMPGLDPVEQAVESLTAEYGTLFVIAAGNTSFGDAVPSSISSPGAAPSALTVGAVDRDDSRAGFSNRGPVQGDGALKPDVTAPGVGIVAAQHAAGTIGEPAEPGYTALSGTSMATPHVAGAAALLAQQHPDWTGQQIKATLTGSAVPTAGESAYDQGAGRIDVARAITRTVVSEPASVSFGFAAWPHHDEVAVTKTITYRNLGTTDVTLDLAVDTDAAAGMFSLSANEVTVPAGGTAAVDVTGDARAGTADGTFTGVVLATAGDTVTRTPVGLVREEESYDLTLNYLDDKGQPTGNYDSFLRGLDDDGFAFLYDEDGSVTIRLPKGRYVLDHLILTEDGTHGNSIVMPGIALDRDLTFDVDARDTRPIEVTPPKPATFATGRVLYGVRAENGRSVSSGVDIYTDLGDITTARLGDALPGTTTTNSVSTSWQDEDEVVYGLTWLLPEYPTGVTKVARWRDLAAVHIDMGPGGEGLAGGTTLSASTTSGVWAGGVIGLVTPLPGTRKVYLTTDGLRWAGDMVQVSDFDFVTELYGPARTYRAGRSYDLRFNYPMFGPGVPHLARWEDKLWVSAYLFTDRDGNLGESAVASAVSRLYRDGQLVDEIPFAGGQFEGLPDEAGNYRVTVETARDSRFTLTTAVSAEWTFTSSRGGTGWEPVPANVVRFAPDLDANGAAPAGRKFEVPLRVLDETGTQIRPKQLSVEVSYDEGKTWQRVPVNAKLVATLRHPATATSVSFRASATDTDGNTVKQTVIRAYTLR